MIQILTQHALDTRLGLVIAFAIKLLTSATVERESRFATLEETSRSVAELYAFRRRCGFYKGGRIVGLDESIAALGERDVPVRLGHWETDRGWLAMWLDEQDAPLGVMIFTATSSHDRSGEQQSRFDHSYAMGHELFTAVRTETR